MPRFGLCFFVFRTDVRVCSTGCSGFMCAVEIEIGARFPTPEKFLFQHVLSKPNAQRTMLGAKRWAAQDSCVNVPMPARPLDPLDLLGLLVDLPGLHRR